MVSFCLQNQELRARLGLDAAGDYEQVYMCSYERAGWLGCRDPGFSNGILVSGLEILPYEHFSPVTGMKAG